MNNLKEKIIVMNWKCNPTSISDARNIAVISDKKKIIICPPAVFLNIVKGILKNATLGAQDGYVKEGSFTGEYSLKQIKNIGAKYVILGHSERRIIFNETSEDIAKKVITALDIGISPIVCIGEKKKNNLTSSIKEIITQMEKSLDGVEAIKAKKIILAYEPVWAISGGDANINNARIEDIEPIIKAVIEKFKKMFGCVPKILYGGSVSYDNINTYIQNQYIQGVLIGSASVDKNKIKKILTIIKN